MLKYKLVLWNERDSITNLYRSEREHEYFGKGVRYP